MHGRQEDWFRLVLLAAGYFCLAWLGLRFATINGNVTTLWPASGLALAALLQYGWKLFPGVFIGAFAAGIYAGDALWLSAGIALGNMLEPMAALWLLHRTGFSLKLEKLRDLYLLLGLGGLLAPLVSVVFGVGSLRLAGFVDDASLFNAALHWWMGDSLGVALLVPGLLVWRACACNWHDDRRALEAVAMLLVSFLVGAVTLGGWMSSTFLPVQKGFWVFPLLIWAAVRFGRHGVFVLLVMFFLQSLWGVMHGIGFFGRDLENSGLVNLWFYHLVLIVSSMTLAIVLKERHELQRQAQDGRNLLRGLINSLNDRIYFLDRDLRILGCNETVERDMMQSEQEMLGKPVAEVFPEDIVRQICPINTQVIEHGMMFREKVYLTLNAMGERIFDLQKLPFRSDRGEVIGVITVARDITDEEQLHRELARERAMLRGVMDSIPDLISFKDTSGIYLGCNKSFERYVGADTALIVGGRDSDFIDADTAKRSREQDRSVLEQETPRIDEEWLTYPDGRQVLVETLRTPLRSVDGQLLGLIGISRDITERRLQDRERDLLHHTIASSLNEVYIFNAKTLKFRYVNRGALTNLGYSMDELRQMTPLDLKPFFTQKSFDALIAPLVGGDKPLLVFETFHRRKNGSMYPVEVHLQRFDQGPDSVFLAIIQDITERLSAEHRLRLASRVFEASAQGIIITNDKSEIVLVNHAFTSITGYHSEEAVGRNPRFLSSGNQPRSFYQDMWAQLNETGHWAGEVWNRRKSGDIYPQWLEISVLKGMDGRVENYIGLFSDISERKLTEAQIRRLAEHDYLTGLPNRMLFSERFSQVLALAKRNQSGLALLFIDLDSFKEINDSMGHEVGDIVLKEVARRLSATVRETDTVSRMGGDEFVVLVPGVDGKNDLVTLAEKLLVIVSEPIHYLKHELIVTPSIGIAVYPTHGEDVDTLMRRADIAMYGAKQGGRCAYRFYEPGMAKERQ